MICVLMFIVLCNCQMGNFNYSELLIRKPENLNRSEVDPVYMCNKIRIFWKFVQELDEIVDKLDEC